MPTLENLLQSQNIKATARRFSAMTEEERVAMEIQIYNESDGDLNSDGIDCSECRNKGYIMKNKDGYKTLYPCKCMIGRRNKALINKSGLGKLLSLYRMDTFRCEATWQYNIKNSAIRYADLAHKEKWFYIGGQVGSGKTHICTAMVSILIDKGIEVRYMIWRDDIAKLKASTFGDGTPDLIQKWKSVPVLYIDDFFKSDTKPTVADINLAFEILNYRYNNGLSTIISSEYDIDIILSIDEAIGSRIIQMCGPDFCLNVLKDLSKNIRLKKENGNANDKH